MSGECDDCGHHVMDCCCGPSANTFLRAQCLARWIARHEAGHDLVMPATGDAASIATAKRRTAERLAGMRQKLAAMLAGDPR